MFTQAAKNILAPLACLAILAGVSSASPTDNADSSAEYNAYVYTFIATGDANALASSLDGSDAEVGTAQLIADFMNDAFNHCFDALTNNDDSQWALALDDLQMARFWCDTLIVFVEDHPNSVKQSVNSMIWYLDIAITNTQNAIPKTKAKSKYQRRRYTWKR